MSAVEPGVPFLPKAVSYVAAGFLYAIGKTSFIVEDDHPSFLSIRRNRKPCIYAFWHNQQVFLVYGHRREGINVVVSQSKDGEYIAQPMERMGFNPIRGSSTRGGVNALRTILKVLSKGKQTGFTPDGPRGPLGTVHPGVIAAAVSSGAPVVPIGTDSRRKIVFNSWDRFFVPLPFSTVSFVHSKPFVLSKDVPFEEAEEEIRSALTAAQKRAKDVAAAAPSWGFFLTGALMQAVYLSGLVVFWPLLFAGAMVKYGVKRTTSSMKERFGVYDFVRKGDKTLWLHAASIGEWQALRPVYDALRKSGRYHLAITVSTPEARAMIRRQEPDQSVFLLPLDLPWAVRPALARIAPEALVIVETELWPVLIGEAHRARVPVIVINGRMSKKTRDTWIAFRPFAHRFLNKISHFFVRTPLDAERYIRLGAPKNRVHVTGNLKYDNLRVATTEQKSEARRALTDDPGPVLIGGSTWPGEEKLLLEVVKENKPAGVRLILAPRRPERWDEVKGLLQNSGLTWSSWKEIKNNSKWSTAVLLLDTLGDLKNMYVAADAAFIGGSVYPKGGQSPLEPSAARLPLIYGPSMDNFHEESAALLAAGAARQGNDEAGVRRALGEILTSGTLRASMGSAAAATLEKMQGAAATTMKGLMDLLDYE